MGARAANQLLRNMESHTSHAPVKRARKPADLSKEFEPTFEQLYRELFPPSWVVARELDIIRGNIQSDSYDRGYRLGV